VSNGRPARRRLSRSQTAVANLLGPLDGERVPGGCGSCNAYQEVRPVTAGMFAIQVHHDEWCPFLNRRHPTNTTRRYPPC